MEEEIKKRIKAFIRSKDGSVKKFEEKYGLSNGALNNAKYKIPDMVETVKSIYPDMDTKWIMFGDDSASQSEQGQTVPCINAFVIGGSLSEQIDGGNINTLDRVITPVGGAEMAIEVSGDSMEPEYPKGARLFCRRIDDLSFIEWGKVYVLDTTQGAIVKEIQPGEDEGTFTCKSINAKRYKPFEIPVSSVRGLWRILAVLILK